MDLQKSYEFLKPDTVTERIHIVGCGSVGSTVAENLARCGFTKFTLYDFDKVEEKNIVNQMFAVADVGNSKVEALKRIITDINPDAERDIRVKPAGWNGENMAGHIFLCVDNIDIRRKIVEQHMASVFVKSMFDFRTSLESAQHFAADWSDTKMRQYLLNSMQFGHEEAEVAVSACGTTLGVATTVRLVSAFGVNNFINYVKGRGVKKFINVDGFRFCVDAF